MMNEQRGAQGEHDLINFEGIKYGGNESLGDYQNSSKLFRPDLDRSKHVLNPVSNYKIT